jgi:hypothetical protein
MDDDGVISPSEAEKRIRRKASQKKCSEGRDVLVCEKLFIEMVRFRERTMGVKLDIRMGEPHHEPVEFYVPTVTVRLDEGT